MCQKCFWSKKIAGCTFEVSHTFEVEHEFFRQRTYILKEEFISVKNGFFFSNLRVACLIKINKYKCDTINSHNITQGMENLVLYEVH